MSVTRKKERETKNSDFDLKGVKVVIENLGPVSKAEIVLGDYTALIGPTNSGKTFIILAVNRLISSWVLFFDFYVNILYDEANNLLANKQKDTSSKDIKDLAVDRMDENLFKKAENKTKNMLYYLLKNGFLSIFGLDTKNLVSFGKEKARVSIEKDEHGKIEFVIDVSKKDISFSVEIATNYNNKLKETYIEKEIPLRMRGEFPGFLIDFQRHIPLFRFTRNPPYPKVGHIPAERMATMSAFAELIDFYAKSQGYRSIGNQESPSFSKPTIANFLGDYIKIINSLHRLKVSPNAEKLIEGKVNISKKIIQKIEYTNESNTVKPQAISSGISQLIPLVLMAESKMYPILTVEEPEVNLHANKAVEVAEYLWSLDTPMFITTHSEYFLMKMAHLSVSKGIHRQKTLKVYLLMNRTVMPLGISEKGELDEIKTIGDVINNLLSEIDDKEGKEHHADN
ncbi:MAG: AAA family ATPase [Thermodesulfobium sp.]